MPKCGSQCYLCDLPIRIDSYKGCSHACRYCFAKAKTDIQNIEISESINSLKNFIVGKKRNLETNWCDWNIPLHWGGLSDPFQPCEKTYKISLAYLKLFKETQYPFVVSTKGKLIIEQPYLDLIKQCNCVVQISMVCDKYDKLELGAPSFNERLNMLEILSKNCKRTIVRVQPYMHEVFNDVFANLKKFKDAGAYGVIIEGMKFKKSKPGLIKLGGDSVYPYKTILSDFIKLKDEAHKLGLKIYAGENRIRKHGDSLTCCGVDGLTGFEPNRYNLNHILNGDKVLPTDGMKKEKTGTCFNNGFFQSEKGRVYREQSFANDMVFYYKENKGLVDKIMGITH